MEYQSITVVNVETNPHEPVVKVEVSQSRTIRTGDNFYMVPSQGYAGIDLGMVQVIALGSTDSIYQQSWLTNDVAKDIGEFTELDLQAYDEHTDDWHDRQELLANGLWVVYQYPKGDIYVFPIEEFLEHSVRMV